MPFGFNPYSLALKAAVILVAFGLGAWSAHKVTHDAWMAADAKNLEAAEKARDVQEQKITAISAELEQAKAKRDVEYQTITKTVNRIVEKPVYRDRVCLDADGLSAANAALGFPAADSRKPPKPVPAAKSP